MTPIVCSWIELLNVNVVSALLFGYLKMGELVSDKRCTSKESDNERYEYCRKKIEQMNRIKITGKLNYALFDHVILCISCY